MKRAYLAMAVLSAVSFSQATEYHVAKRGHNGNAGSAKEPFVTIQHAADIARPGDIITVHEGIYREQINPPRGGIADGNRIVYQAAPGEKVVIKGSEVVKNWTKVTNDTWKVVLPNSFFGDFNPYSDLIRGDWFSKRGRDHHTGAVYLNGNWLMEAASQSDVFRPAEGDPLCSVAWLEPGNGLDQTNRVFAGAYIEKDGVRIEPCLEGGQCVGWFGPENWPITWVKYREVDFGEGTENLMIRAAAPTLGGGLIDIRIGDKQGELLGTCLVTSAGWQNWSSFNAKIKKTGGKKDLCLVFRSSGSTQLKSALWFGKVDAENTTIWAQFSGTDPNEELVEINVRQTVFYPRAPGKNYITVRGFTMQQAATPWAPPTAEQIGLIGTHWSKGWIIEDNTISHSICTGITLGKYGDEWDNTSADTADGYNETIKRALKNGWNRETVGSHIVKNNHIYSCEQAGIVGSLGAIYSTITGNYIHDVHVYRLFSGAEQAGIKFHAAIDTVISKNHLARTNKGIWLDWMTQGTHVTQNLSHDQHNCDMFIEVNHGPCLVDNNIFLSELIRVNSSGGAYVHNLIGAKFKVTPYDPRITPYHKPHSTEIAGMHDNPSGDERAFNNILFGGCSLDVYDKARLPVFMGGNVFLQGTKSAVVEQSPLIKQDFDPAVKLIQKDDGFYLDITIDNSWASERNRDVITTEILGKAKIPDVPFVNPDGSPVKIDTDYFGTPRNGNNPFPGPFENVKNGKQLIKVWSGGMITGSVSTASEK